MVYMCRAIPDLTLENNLIILLHMIDACLLLLGGDKTQECSQDFGGLSLELL